MNPHKTEIFRHAHQKCASVVTETPPTSELLLLCSRSERKKKKLNQHIMKCSVHFLALSSEFRRVKRLLLFLASPLGSEQPKQLPKQASVVPSCAQDGPGVPDFFLGLNSGRKRNLSAGSLGSNTASHSRPPLAGGRMLFSSLPPPPPPLSPSQHVCIFSLIN